MLPVPRQVAAEAIEQAVPFHVGLKRRFRQLEQRSGLYLVGPSGWGEFSPFPDYDTRRASRWLLAALESAFGGWPEPKRDSVACNAILPAMSVAAHERAVRQALEAGYKTLKIKVAEQGESAADEATRLQATREIAEAMGVGVQIRIDANGGWSVAEAARRLAAYADLDLQYVEQPCRQPAELLRLREQLPHVRIAVDESIRIDRLTDVAEIADVAILKLSPLGGFTAAHEFAANVGVPVVVSSALETGVGLAASVDFAASLPDDGFAHGLGTGDLLANDPGQLRPSEGAIALTKVQPIRDPGWAPKPTATDRADAARLRQLARACLDELSPV